MWQACGMAGGGRRGARADAAAALFSLTRRPSPPLASPEPMIKNYSDHAANERTFLAWLRTGLATAGFGFLIEKFNLFIGMLAQQSVTRPVPPSWLERIFTPFGRYDGIGLIVIGVAVIVLGGVRFMRLECEIDRPDLRLVKGARFEIALCASLALLAGGMGIYVALQ
jgi:putative membrane protein